jgi:hypothetical protein
MSLMSILIILALLITVGVLVAGLVTMEEGGELDERWSTKLMSARVGAQGLVVVLLLLALLLGEI